MARKTTTKQSSPTTAIDAIGLQLREGGVKPDEAFLMGIQVSFWNPTLMRTLFRDHQAEPDRKVTIDAFRVLTLRQMISDMEQQLALIATCTCGGRFRQSESSPSAIRLAGGYTCDSCGVLLKDAQLRDYDAPSPEHAPELALV